MWGGDAGPMFGPDVWGRCLGGRCWAAVWGPPGAETFGVDGPHTPPPPAQKGRHLSVEGRGLELGTVVRCRRPRRRRLLRGAWRAVGGAAGPVRPVLRRLRRCGGVGFARRIGARGGAVGASRGERLARVPFVSPRCHGQEGGDRGAKAHALVCETGASRSAKSARSIVYGSNPREKQTRRQAQKREEAEGNRGGGEWGGW